MSKEIRGGKEQPQLLETEMRAVLTNEQRTQLTERLINLGAQEKGYQTIRDVYYCPKDVTFFDQIEMDAVGSYSLRLRKVKDQNGSTKVEWNIKQLTRQGDHTAWAEHEVEVPSFDTVDHMIKIMGFKPYVTIEKTRHIYSIAKNNQTYNLLIEDIKDFGPVLEVEAFSTRENVEASKGFILNLMSSIGITEEQIAPKSVTNMIMKQRSKF